MRIFFMWYEYEFLCPEDSGIIVFTKMSAKYLPSHVYLCKMTSGKPWSIFPPLLKFHMPL